MSFYVLAIAFHAGDALPSPLPYAVDHTRFPAHSARMSTRSIFVTRYYFGLFTGGG